MKDCIFLYIHLSKQNSVQFTSELLYMMYKTSEVTTYKLVNVLYKVSWCTFSLMMILEGLEHEGVFNVVIYGTV